MRKMYSEINKKQRHSIAYDEFDDVTGNEQIKIYNNFLGEEKSAKDMRNSILSTSKRGSQCLNTSMFSTKTTKNPMVNQSKRMNSYN